MNKTLRKTANLYARPFAKQVQYFLARHPRPKSKREAWLLKKGPRILANSAPKAGTNLLAQYLSELETTIGRLTYHIDETLPGVARQVTSIHRGQVATAHLPWTRDLADLAERREYQCFLMVRDPRDITVSNMNYVSRMDKSHALHGYLSSLKDDDERLMALLSPTEDMQALIPDIWKNKGLETFLPWADDPRTVVVKFEDLIGPKGGGSLERQIEIGKRIAHHAYVNMNDGGVQSIVENLFGSTSSNTFHKGQIGTWKDHFTERHKDAFKERSGALLTRLGYEQDDSW